MFTPNRRFSDYSYYWLIKDADFENAKFLRHRAENQRKTAQNYFR